MNISLQVRDLFYIYESNGEQVVALRGLHLDVEMNKCLVIRGPNGSGKSTLVKLLTGYLKPTAGEIFIEGANLADIDPVELRRKYIASIDQRGNLLEELTVTENLELGFILGGRTEKAAQKGSKEILVKHGLLHLAKMLPTSLSAGQKQLISLLAALSTRPAVLIADEPSAELDNDSARELYELIKAATAETTILLVTHDQRAEEFADQIVRIQEGRISEQWQPGVAPEKVIDPLGWMRVSEPEPLIPIRAHPKGLENTQPLLVVSNLSLTSSEGTLINNVSATIRAGEIIAVRSTSATGKGKSTLLRLFAGIQSPTSGSIVIAGRDLATASRSERANIRSKYLSYLDQRSSALQHLTLKEFVDPIEEVLDSRFATRGDQPLGSFSGGERATIELYKILAEKKAIAILDEPTSQMDQKRSAEAVQKIFDFAARGGVVVMATREEALLQAADRIIDIN